MNRYKQEQIASDMKLDPWGDYKCPYHSNHRRRDGQRTRTVQKSYSQHKKIRNKLIRSRLKRETLKEE